MYTDCTFLCDLLTSENIKAIQLALDCIFIMSKIIEIEKESKIEFEHIHVRTKNDNDESGNMRRSWH